MLLQMAELHSFLGLSGIHCACVSVYITSPLSIHLFCRWTPGLLPHTGYYKYLV